MENISQSDESYFEFYQRDTINNIISKCRDTKDIWRAFRKEDILEGTLINQDAWYRENQLHFSE